MVVALHVQPRGERAALGAPLQQRGDHVTGQPAAAVLEAHLQLVDAQPVAVEDGATLGQRLALPGYDDDHPVLARLGRDDRQARGRAEPAPGPRHRPQAQLGLAVLERHPSGGQQALLADRPRLDLRERVTVAGGVPLDDVGGRGLDRDAGVADRQAGVGTLVEPAHRGGVRAQQPLAERLGVGPGEHPQPAHLRLTRRHPVTHRRPGRHRLAGDDVGQRDAHRLAGLRGHDALAVAPRQAGAEQVGERRSAGGTGLASQQPPHHDPLTHDVRAQAGGLGGHAAGGTGRHAGLQRVGFLAVGHAGILGCQRC